MTDVDRILARLRAAQTVDEVEAIADEERATVMAMKDNPELGARYHHIVNLKKYRLKELSR